MRVKIKYRAGVDIFYGEVKLFELIFAIIKQQTLDTPMNFMYISVYNFSDLNPRYKNWKYINIPLTKIAFR